MNKEQLEALSSLKLQAEDAAKFYGEVWDSALVDDDKENGKKEPYHAIISEKTQAIVVRALDGTLHSSWLCDYLEAVSPKNMLSLIDLISSQKNTISSLQRETVNVERLAGNELADHAHLMAEARLNEKKISAAYVRLREILGAMNPPSTDFAALAQFTEDKAKELLQRVDSDPKKDFQRGFFCAIAIVNFIADQPTTCADAIKEGGYVNADCSDFDEWDKNQLRIIVRQSDVELGGL